MQSQLPDALWRKAVCHIRFQGLQVGSILHSTQIAPLNTSQIAESETQQQGALGPAVPGQMQQQVQPTFSGASGQQAVTGSVPSPAVSSGVSPGIGGSGPGGWDSAWGGGRRPLP